jgi:hypothetical protein
MAPCKSTLMTASAVAAVMAAPFAFVQSPAATSALRGAEMNKAVLKEAASEQPPMAGIVGPSIAGAAVVTAAISSLSTRQARKTVALRALPKPAAGKPATAGLAADDAPVTPLPPQFNPALEMGAGLGGGAIGFFDPLDFCGQTGADKSEVEFRKLRSSELKHGRVAMMASVGAVGQHFVRFPGFENCKGTFGAALSPAGTLGFFTIFAACSVLELAWRERPDSRWAGDYNDPFDQMDKWNIDEMREKEINNGRMAMISCLAIWIAEVVSGKDAMEQFGFPAYGEVVEAAAPVVAAAATQ